MTNHPNRAKKVTIINFWTGASLDAISLAQALREMRKITHPMDQDAAEKDVRRAFREHDGKALFLILRT